MKASVIFAILGAVFGFLAGIGAIALSGLINSLVVNGVIAIFASIVGLLGIWLTDKDFKIATVQYIVAAVGLIIGTFLLGSVGALFYFLAAIFVYKNGNKKEGAMKDE